MGKREQRSQDKPRSNEERGWGRQKGPGLRRPLHRLSCMDLSPHRPQGCTGELFSDPMPHHRESCEASSKAHGYHSCRDMGKLPWVIAAAGHAQCPIQLGHAGLPSMWNTARSAPRELPGTHEAPVSLLVIFNGDDLIVEEVHGLLNQLGEVDHTSDCQGNK